MTVILSDVLGDDLSAIASGPTAPDPTTYQEAVAILKRHRIWRAIPPRVRRHLDRGCQGLASETPKPGSSLFRRVHHSYRREQRCGRHGCGPRSQRSRSSNPRAYAGLNRRGPRRRAEIWRLGEGDCARGYTATEALLCGGRWGNHCDRHWKGNRREGARVCRSCRSGNCRSGQSVGRGDRHRWHRWSD